MGTMKRRMIFNAWLPFSFVDCHEHKQSVPHPDSLKHQLSWKLLLPTASASALSSTSGMDEVLQTFLPKKTTASVAGVQASSPSLPSFSDQRVSLPS